MDVKECRSCFLFFS